jgi:hypothetical protein
VVACATAASSAAAARLLRDALAWVCMILVDPAERGHGIGSRIVSGVLDRLSDMRAVGLDADAVRAGRLRAPRLRGDEPPAAHGGASDVGRGGRVAGSPAGVPADFESVLALDRDVFGADRGDLLRAAAARAPRFVAVAMARSRATASGGTARGRGRSVPWWPRPGHSRPASS